MTTHAFTAAANDAIKTKFKQRFRILAVTTTATVPIATQIAFLLGEDPPCSHYIFMTLDEETKTCRWTGPLQVWVAKAESHTYASYVSCALGRFVCRRAPIPVAFVLLLITLVVLDLVSHRPWGAEAAVHVAHIHEVLHPLTKAWTPAEGNQQSMNFNRQDHAMHPASPSSQAARLYKQAIQRASEFTQ